MTNPVLTGDASLASASDTRYFAAVFRMVLQSGTANFRIEVPSSVTLVKLTSSTKPTDLGAHTIDTTHPPAPFADTVGGVTFTVTVSAFSDVPSAGRTTVDFNIAGSSGLQRFMLVEMAAPTPQTYVAAQDDNAVNVASIVGDPNLSVPAGLTTELFETELFDKSVPSSLRGIVKASQLIIAGVSQPPGPPNALLPQLTLNGTWSQALPANVASGLLQQFVEPEPSTNLIYMPSEFRTPVVAEQITFTFRLLGQYVGSSMTSPPESQLDQTLTVKPRPRNMLVVVDRTGSMGSLTAQGITSFEFARQAAHVWCDLWVAMRATISADGKSATPSVAGDKVGIMIFDNNRSSWGQEADGPAFQIPPAGPSDLAGFYSAINKLAIDLTFPRGCTPIGDAVLRAVDALGAPQGPERYSILLLTDGYENCGRVVIDAVNAPSNTPRLNNELVATAARSEVVKRLTLSSLGLGSRIDEGTMNRLPSVTSSIPGGAGVALEGLYRKVPTPDELMTAFADLSLSTLGANAVLPLAAAPNDDSPSSQKQHAQYFAVSADEQRLVFAVRWDASLRNPQLVLAQRRQGGGTTFAAVGGSESVVFLPVRDTHGLVVVYLPKLFDGTAGNENAARYWRLQLRATPNETSEAQPIADKVLCLVDLRVRADFELDKPEYRIGEPIKVTCRLFAGNAALSGAKVRATLDAPGVGLGTFLAKNGAGYVQPPIPSPGPVINLQAPKAAPPATNDPLHPKMAMLQTLLDQHELVDLPIEHPAAVFTDGTDRLFEDAAHNAGVNLAGRYANTYANTAKEGTYTWRFEVTGQLSDGTKFSRRFGVSTWVGVKIDPVSSPVKLTFGLPAPTGLLAARIDVLPLASNGEFLGPFRAGDLSFTTTAGTFLGELVDTSDGHYQQTIVYAPGEVPVVTVTGQGTALPPVVVDPNPTTKPPVDTKVVVVCCCCACKRPQDHDHDHDDHDHQHDHDHKTDDDGGCDDDDKHHDDEDHDHDHRHDHDGDKDKDRKTARSPLRQSKRSSTARAAKKKSSPRKR